jgi:hypothetical protein
MIAKWLGRRAAELMMFLRDKPMIPCQVDWDYRGHFVDPLIRPPILDVEWDYDDGDDQDISVDTLGEWGKSPRTPKQGWPCE